MSERPRTSPPGRSSAGGRRLSLIAAAAGCAVVLAACGSSGSQVTGGGATTATGRSSPAALSQCMRAHGLTNFPDPTAGSGGLGFNGIIRQPDGSLSVNGIVFNGPALKTAEKACGEYLFPHGPPPQPSASQKRAVLAFARCMRAHGVPNFPDPTFGGGPKLASAAGINPQSPAFQRAARACGGNGRGEISIPG
jgi:hypothetical protein